MVSLERYFQWKSDQISPFRHSLLFFERKWSNTSWNTLHLQSHVSAHRLGSGWGGNSCRLLDPANTGMLCSFRNGPRTMRRLAGTVNLQQISQTKYFDTLPLHCSQQKIEEKSDDTHTVYRYRLVPTFDFKQGLLRLGPSVEVLEPEELRDEIVDDIRRMAGNYKI